MTYTCVTYTYVTYTYVTYTYVTYTYVTYTYVTYIYVTYAYMTYTYMTYTYAAYICVTWDQLTIKNILTYLDIGDGYGQIGGYKICLTGFKLWFGKCKLCHIHCPLIGNGLLGKTVYTW